VSPLVPFDEITHLFADFEHTAWRLESREAYASDRITSRYERFLRGEKLSYEPAHPWYVNVRTQVARGKRFERVRVVDDPPTEGQRYLLASGLGNVAAGEDIRNISRQRAVEIGLPNEDFWLFDSRIMVRLVFAEDDRTLGVEVTEDPAVVVRGCQVRDLAWHHAIPTKEFGAQVTSGV
jgi:hypothetical protein